MKSKVLVFVIFGVLFFLGILFLFNNENVKLNNKDEKVNTQNEKLNDQNEKLYTLEEAISNNRHFSYDIFKIKEDFNFAEVLIKEFEKVKNIKELESFENKFGTDVILPTLLKLNKDKELIRFLNFQIERYNIPETIGKTKDELIEFSKLILKNYREKGYYDMDFENEIGQKDVFRLSISSLLFNEKLKTCKDWFFEDNDNYNYCVLIINYIHATKKNNYCDNLLNPYYKKLCEDSLEFIK